jgi:hypothetical protein
MISAHYSMIIVIMLLLCGGCNSESDSSSKQSDTLMTIEESISSVGQRPVDFINIEEQKRFEQKMKRLSPDAKNAFWNILYDPETSEKHVMATLAIGYVGDESDVVKLIKRIQNFDKPLSEAGLDILLSCIEALGRLYRRGIDSAGKALTEMSSTIYWQNTNLVKNMPRVGNTSAECFLSIRAFVHLRDSTKLSTEEIINIQSKLKTSLSENDRKVVEEYNWSS